MKSLEGAPQAPCSKPENRGKEGGEKSPAILRDEMRGTETTLLAKFRNAPKRVRTLMNAFLLSTALGISAAEAYEGTKNTDKDIEGKEFMGAASASRIKELKELPPDVTLISSQDRADIYRIDNKDAENEKQYVAVHRTSGKKVLFRADSKKVALNLGADFVELPAVIKSQVEGFMAREKELMERGWLKLPDGKHGTYVPGSEKTVNGKRLHTEVRRVYDPNDNFDIITIWEIDENNNEVNYSITRKGDYQYDKYTKIIEAAKGNPNKP